MKTRGELFIALSNSMDVGFLTLIIPTYNEQQRLSKTFEELRLFMQEHPSIIQEVIFVDDGSTDGTRKRINAFINTGGLPVKMISYDQNKGKGYAVRQGMLAFEGTYGLMIDADMSTSFEEIIQCLPLMKEGCPIIIGTRKERGAVLVKKQPWYRQRMGELYAVFARCITRVHIKDFGCGFKLFSRQAAQDIFSRATINRWTFDTEVLFLAQQLGYPFKEVGVRWKNDEDTRVSVLRDGIQSVIDLVRMVVSYHIKR